MNVKMQWAQIMNFFMYFGTMLPILAVGLFLFSRTTPYHEYDIIGCGAKEDDSRQVRAAKAAAYDLGGKLLGLSLVLASAVYHAVTPVDLLIWGLIGIVAQVVVFYIFEALTPFKVIAEIPAGNVAVGIFSSFASISTGLLLASLISY